MFSAHITQRLKERDILPEEILAIVNNEVDILVIPSDRDRELDLYFGRIQEKYLLVVANRETGTLVAVRKMRKDEKTAFIEETGNG